MKCRVQIFDELKEVFEDQLCLWEVCTLDLNMSLRKDLNLDSLDFIELLNSIEGHFDIDLDLKSFIKCETVRDVVEYIHNIQHINGSEN